MDLNAFLTEASASELEEFFARTDGDLALQELLKRPNLSLALTVASDTASATAPDLSRRLFAMGALIGRNFAAAVREFALLMDGRAPHERHSADVLGLARAYRCQGDFPAARALLSEHSPQPHWRTLFASEAAIAALLARDFANAHATLGDLASSERLEHPLEWLQTYLHSLTKSDAASAGRRKAEQALLSRLAGAGDAQDRPIIGVYDYKTPDVMASSMNIGDTMQTVAVLRHVARHFGAGHLTADDPQTLPHLETLRRTWAPQDQHGDAPDVHVALIDRDFPERCAVTHAGRPMVLIMHGWFLHKVFGQIRSMTLPDGVEPFIMSLYLQRPDDLTDEVVSFFKRHEPVGCRDWSTAYWLLAKGVNAFFSGCVTTTLKWTRLGEAADRPLYIDHPVPEGVSADTVGQNEPRYRPMQFAEGVGECLGLLEKYLAAPEVHTSRLHCYLPATAIGAALTFHPKLETDRRFEGLDGDSALPGDLDFAGIAARLTGLIDLVYGGVREGRDMAAIRSHWRAATAPMVGEARQRLATAAPLVAPTQQAPGATDAAPADALTNVAIAFDERILKRVPPLLRGLLANATGEVRIHALTRGIGEDAFAALASEFAGTDIVQLAMDGQLADTQVNLAGRTTISTMDRLFLPGLLPHIDRVVYVDIDTAVLGDVTELGNWPLGDHAIAARTTSNPASYLIAHRVELAIRKNGLTKAEARDLRLRLAAHGNVFGRYLNAGVLLMSLERLRQRGFTQATIDLVSRYRFEDQEAINLFLQGEFAELGPAWNAAPYADSFDTANIIHWVGGRKPWLPNRHVRKAALWAQYDKPLAKKPAGPDWTQASSYPQGWDKRAAMVAPWLPKSGVVADIGCGAHQSLAKFLAPDVQYKPFDLRAWTPEVETVDLNAGQFPAGRFDAVVLLGVLEYLQRPAMTLRKARRQSDLLVTSYVHPKGTADKALREKRGWSNAFRRRALEQLLAREGWAVAARDIYVEFDDMVQVVYRCVAAEPVLPPTLSPLAAEVRAAKLTYLNPYKMGRLERALAEVGEVGVPGDFVEFGLALGGSGIVIARAAADQGRRFFGLDVFGQIPEPTSEHDDVVSKARYKTIAAGQSTGLGGDVYYGYRENLFIEVSESFRQRGLEPGGGTVSLQKGLFADTWPTLEPFPVALAHLDCDWYEPVAYCLNALVPVLSPGGLIVLDDYHDYGGAKHAVDEFVAENKDFTLLDGDNVILKRDGRGV